MTYQQINAQLSFISGNCLKRLLFLFFTVAVLFPTTVGAVMVEGLFEIEMPVLDESKAIRRAALNDGLIEVLVRVSGDSNILKKIKAPAASSYVKQYKYSVKQTVEGDTSKWLWVQYNETKILNLLRKKAVPIWSEHRSQPVIWLAVRDGSHRYVLKQSDTSLIKSTAETAFHRRGLPALWPRNDGLDRKNVSFADIWAGFSDPLKKASARYSTGSVISANMAWNGKLWTSEWTLLQEKDIRKWSLKGSDYAVLITRAIDTIADAVGQKFAVLESVDVSKQASIIIEVENVNNVERFRRIEKYLSSLSAVQSVQLSQVEPERVSFALILRTKVDDLLTLIKSGSMISQLPDVEPVVVNVVGTVNPDNSDILPFAIKADYRFTLQ